MDRIGAGAFATVWLYHDDELDSPVAVKALADNWAIRHDVRDRFLEEARILRRADSDHVVRVYDIGEVGGTPYFVMSYADRGNLGDLMEAGKPMTPSLAADYVAQAGQGVAVLHRAGVIHRDLKPANLLLRSTDSGGIGGVRVLVADLGVAKATLHASGLTQVVGTPAYMAPEQAVGIGIDRRADVHALGAVAYHLMTGRLVREGGVASLAAASLPPAPSTIVPLPPALDAVILRSLEPDPEKRYPDVPSFTAALTQAAAAPETVRVKIQPPPKKVQSTKPNEDRRLRYPATQPVPPHLQGQQPGSLAPYGSLAPQAGRPQPVQNPQPPPPQPPPQPLFAQPEMPRPTPEVARNYGGTVLQPATTKKKGGAKRVLFLLLLCLVVLIGSFAATYALVTAMR